MNPIPHTPETDALARRLPWFEDPAEALADPVRFLAYAFETATHEDIALLRRYLTEADFRAALAAAPPGIIRALMGVLARALWHRSGSADAAAPIGLRLELRIGLLPV